MKRYGLLFLSVILSTLLTGCSYLGTIQRKLDQVTGAQARKDREIAALQADFAQKSSAKDVEIKEAKKIADTAVDGQIIAISNTFYAQDLLYKSIPSPLRTDIIIHNLGEEGWAAINHRLPTYETMLKINERLKSDLNETKTSLADLQKSHQVVLAENVKISDTAKVTAEKVTVLEKEKVDFTNDFNKRLAADEKERGDLANQNAALQQQKADDAAAIHAMKMKLSMIAGGLALASILGVIYSPLGKGGLAIFGAVCGLASVGIWYITGPVILGAVAVAVIGLVGWGYYQHHQSDKTVTALVGYLHDKGQLADADLKDWMTKYVKQPDGTVTTVPDPAVLHVVDAKLIATDRK